MIVMSPDGFNIRPDQSRTNNKESIVETVTLKRGRGNIKLIKSEDLIAVRPSPQAEVSDVLSASTGGLETVESTTSHEGFRVMKVQGNKAEMEKTLDELRTQFSVDAGTHVYHTAESTAPIVPTGKMTLRFTPDSSNEARQQVLDENHLEIVNVDVKTQADGSKLETFTVKTTPESHNPLKIAERLQQLNGIVLLAEPDLATPGRLYAFQLPSDAWLQEQWHLKNTGTQFGSSLGMQAGADARVVAAWQTAQSLGSPACVVAVIDDGFDLTHPDLSGNGKIVAPWDFGTNTNNPAPKRFNPDHRRGDYHGTACAGVAIGKGGGGKIIGAAPNSRLMPLRWNSSISDDTIKKQFGYASAQGAWVVSCSWGVNAEAYTLSTVMDEAIAECANQGRNGLGCVIVFAAGNANHNINDPEGGTIDGFATHPDVIAVAASNSRDQKSNYSNFGQEISVCAPSSGEGGRGILTSDVRGTFQLDGVTYEAGYERGDYTQNFGGTSSATPLVAGICALVLSANPTLTAKQVKDILQRTARRIGDPSLYTNGHSIYFGHGCVNAEAAVQMALTSRGSTVQIPITPPEAANPNLSRANTTLFGAEFWGIERHELIAAAAERMLKPKAKIKVQALLAVLPQSNLASIAAWADQIKGQQSAPGQDPDTQQFLKDFPNDASRDWHYVNLPLDIASYAQAVQLGFSRSDDVVQMINQCIQVLRGESTVMSKLNALRWLVHLVADIHQPIHVGCGFIDTSTTPVRIERDPQTIRQKNLKHDRGGNNLVLPISGSKNLHSYWDSTIEGEIVEQTDSAMDQETLTAEAAADVLPQSSPEAKARFVDKLLFMVAQQSVAGEVEAAVLADETATLPEQWVMQSLAQARQAYQSLKITKSLSGGKYKVDWEGKAAYDARCQPIVSRQLTLAAQNLASLLNTLLG
jgi:hypothetical protein